MRCFVIFCTSDVPYILSSIFEKMRSLGWEEQYWPNLKSSRRMNDDDWTKWRATLNRKTPYSDRGTVVPWFAFYYSVLMFEYSLEVHTASVAGYI